jgi:hypothetical protein
MKLLEFFRMIKVTNSNICKRAWHVAGESVSDKGMGFCLIDQAFWLGLQLRTLLVHVKCWILSYVSLSD